MLAPGEYCPEKSIAVLDAAPKYTFGFRTNHEKPSDNPGKTIIYYCFIKSVTII